ncbi:MAG: Na(+)-translocating NADH-quinone reductase subunit A [Planctomycetota bacterium]
MTDITRIEKGLDLPITGEPVQEITGSPIVRTVGVVGDDYPGMKPTMLVSEGDRVKRGQALFTDKKNPAVHYTAPVCGVVKSVNRGAKRKFESLVIEIDGEEAEQFQAYPDANLTQLDRDAVKEHLLRSGLWTALRTRPFSKVPNPETLPAAIFVTAVDTHPLAASPRVVMEDRQAEFIAGVEVLTTLTEGPTYVCRRTGSTVPGEDRLGVEFHAFDGPHPAGLVGTHIHTLMPASPARTVWHVGYQDVIAIGHLFLTGELQGDRVISLAGPPVKSPRLVRAPLGASLDEVVLEQLELDEGQQARVISGSVLGGRMSIEPTGYLGRYHNQVSVLLEGTHRDFIGWMLPGSDRFSVRRIFASAWTGEGKRFGFDTNNQGSPRAVVPIGMYEQVMPLDIVATPLIKALITGDTEYAQQLGVLELDEEDLALCSFVDPGKHQFGPMLRESLTHIEAEG